MSFSGTSTNTQVQPDIRFATEDDAEPVASIYAPNVTETIISFEWEPPTPLQMQERIESTLERYPWLVYEQSGRVAGYAYASPHRSRYAYQWSVDVSAYVDRDEQRRGVASALYTSLRQVLVLQGFYNAYAGIALPNPASVGLHEAMGFRTVGVYEGVGYKFNAWHDMGWWQLELKGKPDTPDNPLDLSLIRDSPECRVALLAGLSPLQGPRGKS